MKMILTNNMLLQMKYLLAECALSQLLPVNSWPRHYLLFGKYINALFSRRASTLKILIKECKLYITVWFLCLLAS